MWRLMTNSVYVVTCLGACMELVIVSGFVVFLPKYLETQFSLGKSQASVFTGKFSPYRLFARYRKVGRVGTKFRTLKTGSRLHGWVFGGAEGVFDASPECFRKSKSRLMKVSVFWGSKLCPNSPRQSRLAPLYGTSALILKAGTLMST